MWNCPHPQPNHKGLPQSSVCAEVTQSIPSLLPSSPCWLCGCGGQHSMLVQKVSNMTVLWPDTSLPLRRNPSHFPVFYVTVGSRWCSVLWAISKNLLLFQSGTHFLCNGVKYSKVECERSNTVWIQNLRLFNGCIQRSIIPVRENLCYILDRRVRKGTLTAGK